MDGKLLGRVAGRIRSGYWIEEVDRKRLFRVTDAAIRIVPCASLPR